jgi:hypothetical protein
VHKPVDGKYVEPKDVAHANRLASACNHRTRACGWKILVAAASAMPGPCERAVWTGHVDGRTKAANHGEDAASEV